MKRLSVMRLRDSRNIRVACLTGLFAFLILLITGCAATGPSYTDIKSTIPSLESGKSRLYFLRENAFMLSAVAARVQVNGVKVADIYSGGFVYLDRSAGEAFIMVDASLHPGEWRGKFTLEGGKEYFFLVTPNSNKVMAGVFLGLIGSSMTEGGPFYVYSIPEEMARKQLKTMKLSRASSP